MRWNKCKLYILCAIVLNLLIGLYIVILQHIDLKTTDDDITIDIRDDIAKPNSPVKPELTQDLTIIISETEDFENDLKKTIENAHKLSDAVDVLVICDKPPYPPIKHAISDRIKFVMLEPSIHRSILTTRPENYIRSNFVLFLPDSTSMSNWFDVKEAVDFLATSVHFYSGIAIPVSQADFTCLNLSFEVKTWTLQYSDSTTKSVCDVVLGRHGLLTRRDTLLKFTDPFIRPVFQSFYIQNSFNKHPVYVYNKPILHPLKELFLEPHNRWKHKKYEDQRHQQMLKTLGVKLVKHANGHEEWFGCSKQTLRCFDTVVNDMPEYLYLGRWTPPCCHKALKETVHHVFNILTKCGARFWLEGGSLLGAARSSDIIPWDYDVDIGIYREDLTKCENFQIDSKQSIIDEGGFVWEKAIEGDFYRVQYSESNRLHVDIFPFYSKNGTMTKNTWMKTHRQDREFPESFLIPLTKIKFVGLEAPAPNNVKQFLELKFGSGVIENPKYPNSNDPYS